MRWSGLALLVVAGLAAEGRADVLRILDDPREAAQARVDIIQQARGEIDAVYFLARNDRITLTALSLLRDARRRGVGSVRLIVDANFQHIPRPVLGYLRDEGVEVRVYHPISLRHPSWLFRRMHEKFVVVDGKRYIAGGRNLAESYFGLGDEVNFRRPRRLRRRPFGRRGETVLRDRWRPTKRDVRENQPYPGGFAPTLTPGSISGFSQPAR